MTPVCGLVLSLFPGAGLLDRGFAEAGWCVVRGPDILFAQDIRIFTLAGLDCAELSHAGAVTPQPGKSRFDGIIAGPPCQDFSRARRRPPSGHGIEMLHHLGRLITEARPEWWLVENVPGVPTIEIPGYVTQRFNMFASDFGLDHRRNRSFQFGSQGEKLVIPRGRQSHLKLRPTPLASDYSRSRKRNFAETCERMGLPRRFTLAGLSRAAQFRAVNNGVAVPMAYAVALAIRDRRVTPAQSQRHASTNHV
jgi:DNA (cytosine-5)-methyltransferase 1